nr:MAG TPA: hypothetical protein [Caudoviricetes sp.]
MNLGLYHPNSYILCNSMKYRAKYSVRNEPYGIAKG